MQSKKPPTYESVARRLRKFGFTRQHTEGEHLFYLHPNGAVILLPPGKPKDRVSSLHQVMIRSVLKNHGLIPDNGYAGRE